MSSIAFLLGTVASYPLASGSVGDITTYHFRTYAVLGLPKDQIIVRNFHTYAVLGIPVNAIAVWQTRAYAIVYP